MIDKETLRKKIIRDNAVLLRCDSSNNSYLKVMKDELNKKLLVLLNDKHQYKVMMNKCSSKKEKHALQQLKYRLNNAETIRLQNKHFNDKRTCKHLIAHTEVNPNRDSINLVCGRCGVLMAKTGF